MDENLALPARCNLYLTYLSIIMALNLRHPSDIPLIHLGRNTLQWLKLYAENFGLLVLPPIFEYSLKLAGNCITHSLNTSSASSFSNINWMEMWQHISTALSGAWPVFQISNSLPQSNSMTMPKPSGIMQLPSGSQQSGSNPTRAPDPAPSLSQSTPDHWQVSQIATPRVFIETTPHSFHSPSTIQQQQSQPQFPAARMEPLLDQESIFQEVYDMDANLWWAKLLSLVSFHDVRRSWKKDLITCSRRNYYLRIHYLNSTRIMIRDFRSWCPLYSIILSNSSSNKPIGQTHGNNPS